MSENEIKDIIAGSTPEDLQVLTTKVEQATEELGKLTSKNDQYKRLKAEFTSNVITAIRDKFPNDDKTREEKVVKGLFNKIISSIVDTDAEDKDGYLAAGYLRKRVEEVVMLIYAFRYLKMNDVNKIFDEYGIKLEFDPVENYLTYLNGTDFKATMKSFVDTCADLKTGVDNIKHNIDENIYPEVPATLRYNKNGNPAGIKKGIFKKFSFLNLLKKINAAKAKLKFDKMVEETQIRSKADTLAVSVADTLVSDGNQAI